jgi:hypothetical protein
MAEQDETIAIYSASSFSPELAAKIFFSEHSESEVTNKLHELANLQVGYWMKLPVWKAHTF